MATLSRATRPRTFRVPHSSAQTYDGHRISHSEATPAHLQSGSESRSSDDYQAVSKFVQAMKDPNWRRRDGVEYKSESNVPAVSHHEASEESNHGSGEPSHEDEIEHQSPDEFNPEAWGQFLADRGLSTSQDPSSQKRHSSSADEAAMPESTGLCGVAMSRAIEGPGIPKPLNLIQLIPFYNAQQQAFEESKREGPFDVVKIQRLNNSLDEPERKPTDDLDAQLIEALQTATQTPPKIRPKSQLPTTETDARLGRSVKHERNTNALLRDLAATDIGPIKRTPVQGKELSKMNKQKDIHDFTVSGQQQQHTASDKSNIAFEKMLRKLHRRTDRSTTTESRSSRGDSARHSGSASHSSGAELRAERRHLRNTDSSDASCGSALSNMTGSTKVTSISSSHFNPKAREFLSFSKQEPEIPEEFQHQKFRRLPLADLFKKPGDEQPVQGSRNISSEDQPLPAPHSFPQQPANPVPIPPDDVWKDVLSYLMQTPLGMCPPLQPVLPNMYSTWSPGQVPSMLMPVAMPGLGMPPPLGAGLPTAPSYVPTGPPPGLPANQIPSSYSAPEASNSGLSALPQPQPPSFGNISTRCYVPKPRKPDPGDQLAYEAWIEWRKANEPGYALECKMRQKRRAQRMVVNKAKPSTTEHSNGSNSTDASDAAPLVDIE